MRKILLWLLLSATPATAFAQNAPPSILGPIPSAGFVGKVGTTCAATGIVGECVSSQILIGSAVNIPTSGTAANLTSISLTAGSWLIWGSVGFVPAATTTQSEQAGGLSTISTGIPDPSTGAAFLLTAAVGANNGSGWPCGILLVNISGTTSYYLNAKAVFGVSTDAAYGFIEAVRLR
jgi:hypothetical protein